MQAKQAAAAALLLGLSLTYLSTSPAHAKWRSGACKKGEGVTVVVDWANYPDLKPGATSLIRCYVVPEGKEGMPIESESYRRQVLDAVGVTYKDNGLITNINGLDDPSNAWWKYVRGEPGQWLGDEDWTVKGDFVPLDTFIGVTLSDSGAVPVWSPKFTSTQEPSDPGTEPGTEPTNPGNEPGPSKTPNPTTSSKPTNEPTSKPTPKPSQDPTTASPSTSASREPSPTDSPSQPRVNRPVQQGQNRPSSSALAPAPTATQSPTPIASTRPSEDLTTMSRDTAVDAPSQRPSPVWGKEEPQRQSSQTSASEATKSAPWLAGALGILVAGGLGTAAGFGIRSTKAPPLEDE